MLYRTQTPQYKLHEDAFSKLNHFVRRYLGSSWPTPRDGVTQEKLELLQAALPKKYLADSWDWTNGESITAAFMRSGAELAEGLRSMARAIRICLSAEVFPEGRAGRDARDWLLSDLASAERSTEQFAEIVVLLNATHLAVETHYFNAVYELHRVEAFDLNETSKEEPPAVFALAADELYVPLQEAWETYFLTADPAALEQYIAIAEKLHAEDSPLMSKNFAKHLQPVPAEVRETESLLDRLIVGRLIATVEQ